MSLISPPNGDCLRPDPFQLAALAGPPGVDEALRGVLGDKKPVFGEDKPSPVEKDARGGGKAGAGDASSPFAS